MKPIAETTMQELLDGLRTFLEEDLRELRLPVNPRANDETTPRAMRFYSMALDDPNDWEGRIPYGLLQLLSGADDEKGSSVKIRIVLALYDADRVAGKLALTHVVEKVRLDLQKKGVIDGRFVLQRPFEWLFITDDTGPYHLAELMAVYSLPGIEREVYGLHDAFFE